jgi:hypothetical protein
MFNKNTPTFLDVKYKNCYIDSISQEEKSKLAILVPVSSHIERECEESLRRLEDDGIKVYRKWGFSAIDQGRCVMAQCAIDDGYEHLVWIDSDISFYPWDVYKLMTHGLKFVTGAYTIKGWPRLTTKFHKSFKSIKFGEDGGLYKSIWTATGFMYTHISVYESIVKKYKMSPVKIWGGQYKVHPWFLPMIIKNEYVGEDFSFCERATNSGISIYCDTTIRLDHIGRYNYGFDFLNKTQEKETTSFIYNVED